MSKASEAQRQRWFEEIAAWRQSGESLSAWARERGQSRAALEYWKRRIDQQSISGAGTAIRLIPVMPAAPAPGQTGGRPLELLIERDGLRLVLPPDFDAGTLARLLDIVESRC
jgi:hypothetical protein